MNDDTGKQILEELRKQARFNRKSVLFPFLVLLAFFFLYIPLRDMADRRSHALSETSPSWRQARSLLDKAEYTKALHMTQELVKKSPKWDYGYSLLGSICQAMGDLSKAEENYAKACELFPSEKNEKDLLAIRKVFKSQTEQE